MKQFLVNLLIGGKIILNEESKKIDFLTIESISIMEDTTATNLNGDKTSDSVVNIATKTEIYPENL